MPDISTPPTKDGKTSLGKSDTDIDFLAKEFLIVTEDNIETRTYLVDRVLPTLVLALEKLLVEMERSQVHSKMLTEKGIATKALEDSLNETMNEELEPTLGGDYNFDPINWLSQFLFRNNPRYANFTEASAYMKYMNGVAKELKAKMFDITESKRAAAEAEKQAQLTKLKQTKAIETRRKTAKRRTYMELLEAVYRKWISRLWRAFPGYLCKDELVKPTVWLSLL
jgi:hypothetical protein